MRRKLTIATMAAAMVLAMPLGALAHECLVADRSDTGSQNSSNGNWVYISETEVVGFVAGFVGADPEQVGEAFLAEVEAQGLPTSFSIFVGKIIIGANPTTHELVAAYEDGVKSANGKGIDHASALVERYVAIMLGVM